MNTHFLRVLTSGDVATISSAGRTWISLVSGVEPPKIVDRYSSVAAPLYLIFILFSVHRDILLGEAMHLLLAYQKTLAGQQSQKGLSQKASTFCHTLVRDHDNRVRPQKIAIQRMQDAKTNRDAQL